MKLTGFLTLPGVPALLLWTALTANVPSVEAEPTTRPQLRIETGMHTTTINRIAVDAAGRYMVSASDDKSLRVWNLATGQEMRTICPTNGPGDEGKLYAVALSPDGEFIACGGFTAAKGDDENLYFFERRTGRMVQRISGLPEIINDLTFSRDGRTLAAGLGDGGLRVWRRGPNRVWRQSGQGVDSGSESYGMDFSPAGNRLASAYDDGKVRLYAVEPAGSLRLLQTSSIPEGGSPSKLRFSPNGKLLAVGYDEKNVVRVLDADSL